MNSNYKEAINMEIIKGIKKYASTDRIALKCDGEELSYKDLDKFSESIGA